MSFYDYTLITRKNEEYPLRDLEGKVVLVVNTATGCGFTPHYEALEKLYEECRDQGFEIIDVPCNQFGSQTPGTDEEIHEFCTLTYNTQFPRMKKSDVNGENQLPLFAFLKQEQGFKGFTGQAAEFMNKHLARIDPDFQNNPDIKWNFTKFVIDRKGNVVARFEPTADMEEVAACVRSLL